MKHNLKNFPDKNVAFPLECDGGEVDRLCHKNEQTFIQNLMDITDWKREFERELREMLPKEEDCTIISSHSGDVKNRIALWNIRKLLKEILGEDK